MGAGQGIVNVYQMHDGAYVQVSSEPIEDAENARFLERQGPLTCVDGDAVNDRGHR